MKRLFISSIFIALFLTGNVQAQKRGMQGNRPQGNGTIEGKVIDKNTGDFVEYANIVLLKMRDSKMITGTINVIPKINFVKKVETVASHISLDVCIFLDSSEICIPKASEKASATTITNIPPITVSFE